VFFKRAQILELLGITPDTLRHWKKALPPIAEKDGRADDYTYSELVSLGIVARAVQQVGVQVSLFTPVAKELFVTVAKLLESDFTGVTLYVDARSVGLIDSRDLPDAEAMVLVRLQPVVDDLRSRIGKFSAADEPQFALAL
jgi:hypothetical protein